MKVKILSFLFFFPALFGFVNCASMQSSSEAEPNWLRQPTRAVDAGYIVYLGEGEDSQFEKAVFKSESAAISDLANECSFVPKGARIEDRFVRQDGNLKHSFTKLAVTFEECEQAKKAIDPEEVRKLANVAMTEQLKRFQDLYYVAVADKGSPNDEQDEEDSDDDEEEKKSDSEKVIVVNDDPHYFLYRQRVVYYKQQVILTPLAYTANSPQRVAYYSQVTPTVNQIHLYESSHPDIRKTSLGWSTVQHHPGIVYPAGFRRAHPTLAPRYFRKAPVKKYKPRKQRRRRH